LITGKFNWRINNQIRADEVRVIDSEKKQVGVMKLNEALAKADEAGLDLVEIAPTAKPPVVQIVELGKFKYEQEKRLQKEKRKTKSSELKEIRFSPFIAEHDYRTRMIKIEEFLKDSNKVRLVVVFKGRHMGSKQFGYELLNKITDELGDAIAIDMKPKFLGRHLVMGISPIKKIIKTKEPLNENSQNNLS